MKQKLKNLFGKHINTQKRVKQIIVIYIMEVIKCITTFQNLQEQVTKYY